MGGKLHLIGNYRAHDGMTEDQKTVNIYHPSQNAWIKKKLAALSNNGGCTVKVSPTDVIIISNFQNAGNVPLMSRINLASNGSQKLASPPLSVEKEPTNDFVSQFDNCLLLTA